MSTKKDTHPVPDPNMTPGRMAQFIESDGYDVVEWNPSPDNSAPSEAVIVVHHMKTLKGTLSFGVRFKSAGELDRFIAILGRHRFGVWPTKGS